MTSEYIKLFSNAEILYNVDYDDIKKLIIDLCHIIPDVSLLKYPFEHIDYENKKIDYYNYSKYKYIESCSWLIYEIQKLVRKMVNLDVNKIEEEYHYDTNILPLLALTTNPEINTNFQDLQINWISMNYLQPFFLIKEIIEKKGYEINTYSNKTTPDIVKNNELYDCFNDYHYKPIETFILVIKKNKK